MVNFTPLNMPMEKLLLQIKDDPNLKWLKPLTPFQTNEIKRSTARFHKDHSHTTEECRDLKGQIKELILKGKLQKFVRKKDHHY